MDLLEIEGMVGVPSPYLSNLDVFRKIIDRDDDPEKREAAKELAFIHFYCHHDSAYASWDKDIRETKVVRDVWGKESDWKPDELVKEAMTLYKEQISSEYTRLLDAARNAANKLIDHFEDLVFDDPKEAKDVINNISKIGDVVEGLDKLKEQIAKHESKQNSNRANVKTNQFSE